MKFDEPSLIRELSPLPKDRVISFAAVCADRLIRSTVILEGSTDISDLLAYASESIWKGILGRAEEDIASLEDRLLNTMPNEDDEASFQAAVVEDACAALVYALRGLRNHTAQNAAWAARRAYETADRYVSQFINEDGYSDAVESKILNHSIVQQELNRQYRDIQAISSNDNTNLDLFMQMIDRRESILIK